VRALDGGLILLGPALSALVQAGREAGLAMVEEVFAERQYTDAGHLVPPAHPQAMVHGAAASVAQLLRILKGRALVSINGTRLLSVAGSTCVHGDNADAVATARTLRAALRDAGFTPAALPLLAASG
jgi:5-oxoprolinase (ATP-hydrolysing) subunit A